MREKRRTEKVLVAVAEAEPEAPVEEHMLDKKKPVARDVSQDERGESLRERWTHTSRCCDLRTRTWPDSVDHSSRHCTPRIDQIACREGRLSQRRRARRQQRRESESWTHVLRLVLEEVGPQDGAHLEELGAVEERSDISNRYVVRVEEEDLVERRLDEGRALEVERFGAPAVLVLRDRVERGDGRVEEGELRRLLGRGRLGREVKHVRGEGAVVREAEEAQRSEDPVERVLQA